MPPEIATRHPGNTNSYTLENDGMTDGTDVCHSRVGNGFHRYNMATAVKAVAGDDRFGFSVGKARAERVGAIARKERQHNGTDLYNGQQSYSDLRHHRHVECDHVAFSKPQVPQRVGETIDLTIQLGIGECPFRAFLPL